MSTAVMSSVAVVSAAGVSGLFAWLSHRGNTKVAHVAAVLDAYNEIVKNLQNELNRVQNELDTVREAMADCDRRSMELRYELEAMKAEMARMNPKQEVPRKRTRKVS